jgi:CheY-like chemotaxis protein
MKKILVADDNPDIVTLEAMYLELHGYLTVVATTGVEALERMVFDKPDLIILDLMIPEKNGWQVLEKKASMPEFAHVPVIIYSAYSSIPEPMIGVFSVVKKPADPAILLARVVEAIGS